MTYATYIGNGIYLIGVPARDMSREEWESLSEEMRDRLLRMGLMYVRPEPEPEELEENVNDSIN